MASARRMLEDNLKIIDAALVMLDARLPYSSRNPDLDRLLKNKKQIYIMNKADLADPDKTKLWLSYFRARGCESAADPIRANPPFYICWRARRAQKRGTSPE